MFSVGLAGFLHESNTFSSKITTRADFEANCLVYDDLVIERWRDSHHELGGFLEGIKRNIFRPQPLVAAMATPGGPVEHAFVDEWIDAVCSRFILRDTAGLLLALHGALVTTEVPSGDTYILEKLRAALGPEFPIICTLDFHGNCTAKMVEAANGVFFYQTNPHTDMRAKGLEATSFLSLYTCGNIAPVCAFRKPSLLIPINHQNTSREPWLRMLNVARVLEQQPGMLSVSLAAGFPYADVPDMGPSIVAYSDNKPKLAEQAADIMVRFLDESRPQFTISLPGPREAVTRAREASRAPVVLVDYGDNVGGGAPGDGTFLLQELLDQNASGAVMVLADPEAARTCVQAGIGATVNMHVGGKTDQRHGAPVAITGRVRSLHDGQWVETAARHGGVRYNDQGLTAVLAWGDGNLLCLTTRKYPPFSLGQITSLGIDPSKQRILVVKAAIAYRAAYEPIAAEIIEVDTPGLTAVNPRQFEYKHIRRPLWPLDE